MTSVNDWTSRTLGEVVEDAGGVIRTGPFGSQLHAHEYIDDKDGVPVVMPRDMQSGRILRESVHRIAEETANRLSVHRMSAGDVVLARRGDIGRLASVGADEEGWVCGTGSIRVHAPDHDVVDPRFLKYLLVAPEAVDWLAGQAVGATMPNLNREIVSAIPVSVPTIKMQRRIAAVLSAFDDLIEINERRIELLEDLARSLYREWFVHFRFPGHEEVEFVDSELGPIPEGWSVCALGDVANLRYGKSLPARNRRPGSVAVVSSAGIVDNHDQALVEGPGVVIGRKGNVGSVWWVGDSFFPIDTTYYVETELHLGFLYWRLRHAEFINSHAAVPGLSRDQANSIRVVVPPVGIVQGFGEMNSTFFGTATELRDLNRRLAATRDLLLPRLITGKLDISDIDLGVLTPEETE